MFVLFGSASDQSPMPKCGHSRCNCCVATAEERTLSQAKSPQSAGRLARDFSRASSALSDRLPCCSFAIINVQIVLRNKRKTHMHYMPRGLPEWIAGIAIIVFSLSSVNLITIYSAFCRPGDQNRHFACCVVSALAHCLIYFKHILFCGNYSWRFHPELPANSSGLICVAVSRLVYLICIRECKRFNFHLATE